MLLAQRMNVDTFTPIGMLWSNFRLLYSNLNGISRL
jgi:hypothetical protein